jgi:hypothetical protein
LVQAHRSIDDVQRIRAPRPKPANPYTPASASWS